MRVIILFWWLILKIPLMDAILSIAGICSHVGAGSGNWPLDLRLRKVLKTVNSIAGKWIPWRYVSGNIFFIILCWLWLNISIQIKAKRLLSICKGEYFPNCASLIDSYRDDFENVFLVCFSFFFDVQNIKKQVKCLVI